MERRLNRLMREAAASQAGAVMLTRGSLYSMLRIGAFFAGRMPEAEKRRACRRHFLDLLEPVAAEMAVTAEAMFLAEAAAGAP